MTEVLHAFGVDWKLIIIQVVNFALLMGALWYFLYTPVLNLLKERQEKIERGVKDAEEAAKSREAAESEKVTVLQKAHGDAEGIVATAKVSAKEKESEILAGAEERASHIVENAEMRSTEIEQKAVSEAESSVAKMAVLAAEKILKESK